MGAPRRAAPARGLALLLLLLPPLLPPLRPPGAGAAPVQGSGLPHHPCKSISEENPDKPSQKCCDCCNSGHAQKMKCRRSFRCDCFKPACEPGQYLDLENLRCQTCVTCRADLHLVEKAPCTANSSRVCECQPGWYCQTSVENTCFRCSPHSTCRQGYGVKVAGTAVSDTVCEKCPPGTSSDMRSSIQTCQKHTEYAKLNKVPTSPGVSVHDKHFLGQPTEQVAPRMPGGTTVLPPGTSPATSLGAATRGPGTQVNTSHLGVITLEKRSRDDSRLAQLGAVLLSVLVLFAGLVILRRRRACDKWIVPHKAKISSQAMICAKKLEALAKAEDRAGEGEPLAEASADDGRPPEAEGAPSLEPDGAEPAQVAAPPPPEPPPQGHGNNHIEKVYIMKAETVIVGSVLEAPSGKSCPTRDEDGSSVSGEGAKETELAMRYPEQETERCPGSDFTTPVEEEWEFHHSGEKTLAI